MIPGHVLEKNTRNVYTFFSSLFQQKTRPHGRLYGRLCRTRTLCSTLIRAALLLVLFPAEHSNKNDGPRGRFNCISTVSCKGSVCVEVLTNFYGRFFVEEGQFIEYTPSTSSLHLGSHFFHLLTPPRFGALNLPEVNQFGGNCFRMVRIVLKITFLGLRYPKGVTGSVPLCPIMALATQCVILTHCYVTHHPRQLSPLLPRFGFLLLLW